MAIPRITKRHLEEFFRVDLVEFSDCQMGCFWTGIIDRIWICCVESPLKIQIRSFSNELEGPESPIQSTMCSNQTILHSKWFIWTFFFWYLLSLFYFKKLFMKMKIMTNQKFYSKVMMSYIYHDRIRRTICNILMGHMVL